MTEDHNSADIGGRVRKVLVERMGISETSVTPDAHLSRDLGIDSLDYAELVMEFEHEFNIRIPHQDTEQLETVKQAEAYILRRLGSELEG